MINGFPLLRPFRIEDLGALREGAREDQHGVAPPVFTVEKNGELLGYFHISPSVLAWLSTKKLSSRDTFNLINNVENHIYCSSGLPMVQFPVPKASPMHEVMPLLGFTAIGEYTLYTKGLT